MLACVDREDPLADSVIKPDAVAIKRRRLGAKPWRAHEESATEPEPVSHTPKGRRRSTGGEDRFGPVFQPNKGVPIRKYPGYPRWRAALGSMPLAITIATVHGPVGIVHAEAPHHSWAESLRLFGTAAPSLADDVLLGLERSLS